jgi:hypothetical protein
VKCHVAPQNPLSEAPDRRKSLASSGAYINRLGSTLAVDVPSAVSLTTSAFLTTEYIYVL